MELSIRSLENVIILLIFENHLCSYCVQSTCNMNFASRIAVEAWCILCRESSSTMLWRSMNWTCRGDGHVRI